MLYYELPIPDGLKKFSKGSPIGDEHFDELRQVWQRWNQYRKQGGERPFGLASDLREQWRVHRLWEAYRNDMTGKVPRPQANVGDSELAIRAHRAEGPKPMDQINVWVDTCDDVKVKGFDLSISNPHITLDRQIPKPWEITASLIEQLRELNIVIETMHKELSNGED